MKRKYIVVILILSAIFLISAIILYNIAAKEKMVYYEQDTNKVQIRLLSDWGYTEPEGRIFQECIADFNEQNTDVYVVNDVQSKEEYFTHLKIDFASGNEPDIFISWPCEDVNIYAEQGKLTFLNDYLNEDENWYDSFDKSIWNKVSYNGKVIALPLENIYTALFVNKKILDECGIAVPDTYSELKTSVVKLRKSGYIPIAFDISDSGFMLYKAFVAKLGGKFYSDEIKKADGSYNVCYVRAAQMLKELYELKAFPDNLFSITENNRKSLFLDGQAAFIVSDSHFLNQIYQQNRELYDNLVITYIPEIEGERSLSKSAMFGVGQNTLYVSKKATADEQKEEKVKLFLKYMTSGTVAGILKSRLGAITAVMPNNYAEEDIIARQNNKFIYQFSEAVNYLEYYTGSDEWNRIVNKAPKFLEGIIDVNEFLR